MKFRIIKDEAVDVSIIQKLIDSEKEAIELYTSAIKASKSQEEKMLYQHILDEEIEHLEELDEFANK